MNDVIGQDSALKGYTGPGTTWVNEMKFVMIHAPDARLIARSADQLTSTLVLYHRCPFKKHYISTLIIMTWEKRPSYYKSCTNHRHSQKPSILKRSADTKCLSRHNSARTAILRHSSTQQASLTKTPSAAISVSSKITPYFCLSHEHVSKTDGAISSPHLPHSTTAISSTLSRASDLKKTNITFYLVAKIYLYLPVCYSRSKRV